MKPTKCPAREKKQLRQEKQKKRGIWRELENQKTETRKQLD